ncbi:MAG: hypothetical protein ACKOK8_08140 [Planctomycetia bacterium]
MKLFGCMARRAFASLTTAGLLCAGPTASVRAAGQPAAEEIDALVAGLGADDYAEREAAAAKLNALGAAAVDPLLAATRDPSAARSSRTIRARGSSTRFRSKPNAIRPTW